jgi:predicted MFS family arabinose efflux permease
MTSTNNSRVVPAPVYWLAVGAFAIGTEGFMISPLLPGLSSDLGVSVATAGQLVTLFALAYAVSSPVLTALTGAIDRRRLLLASITTFAASNLVAAIAPSFWALMGARVLLALSAGLFVPGANALAGAIVAPERRGRAIAVVNAGITVAIALGVPLGALVGRHLGWRATFVVVAVLSAFAAAGVAFGLKKGIGAGLPVASLRERAAVAGHPAVLVTLLSTTLWATGAYTLYTYLSPFLAATVGLGATQISGVMFLWGLSAAIGVFAGGALTDRVGTLRVIVPGLMLGATAFLALGVSAAVADPGRMLAPVLVAIVVWGLSHWGFWPAQQARLIELAGVKVAPIAMSLNASFMYLGFSAGAGLGGWTVAHHPVGSLGFVAAGADLAAVLTALLLAAARARTRVA